MLDHMHHSPFNKHPDCKYCQDTKPDIVEIIDTTRKAWEEFEKRYDVQLSFDSIKKES